MSQRLTQGSSLCDTGAVYFNVSSWFGKYMGYNGYFEKEDAIIATTEATHRDTTRRWPTMKLRHSGDVIPLQEELAQIAFYTYRMYSILPASGMARNSDVCNKSCW